MTRKHPWRAEHPDAVIVARPSKWGNPLKVAKFGRDEALRRYREHLRSHPELVAEIRRELAGKDLCCWCGPDVECHADELIRIANSTEDGTK